jgi:hypothetical protein
VSVGQVCSKGGPFTVSGGSLCLDLVLLLGTCIERRKLLLTPIRDAPDIQAPRKVSTEASNPSKDEMCFNVSLSISIQVSTTIGSKLSSALNPKQSSSLGQTPLRRVCTEKVMWHHSSMEVVGSRTFEFPDPSECRTWYRLWGPDSAQSGTQRRATPRERPFKLLHEPRCRINNHLPPRLVCNNVHRIILQFVAFCIFIPHVVSYFLPVSHLVRVVQSCHRWVCLRYL